MASGPRVELMLRNLGFSGNPFTLREADREGYEGLESYFFEHAIFPEVLGNVQRLESVVVLARRGAGKTTFRQAIELRCRMRYEAVRGILDVTYADFSRPLTIARRRGVPVDISLHVNEILRCAMARWLDSLDATQASGLLDKWQYDEMALLKGYLSSYSPLLSAEDYGLTINRVLKRISHQMLGVELDVDASGLLRNEATMASLHSDVRPVAELFVRLSKHPSRTLPGSSYMKLLRGLIEVLCTMGYEGIYVLVDRVDETSLLPNPGQVVQFIAPLLTDLALLDEERVAFKIFLPQHLEELLAGRIDFRSKRIPVKHLAWSADDLLELLARRIRAFSNYNSLQIFCERDIGAKVVTFSRRHPKARYVDVAIVESANNLPRDLILRCRKLLDTYEVSHDLGLISEAHLQEAITLDLGTDEPGQIHLEKLQTPSVAPDQPASQAPSQQGVPSKGLFVDHQRRVWRDGQLLGMQPSATAFKLLTYLCAHRYEICPYEDVLKAVWDWGGDMALLNTTLKRLRKVVEFDSANPTFILRHQGRGIQLVDGLSAEIER